MYKFLQYTSQNQILLLVMDHWSLIVDNINKHGKSVYSLIYSQPILVHHIAENPEYLSQFLEYL